MGISGKVEYPRVTIYEVLFRLKAEMSTQDPAGKMLYVTPPEVVIGLYRSPDIALTSNLR